MSAPATEPAAEAQRSAQGPTPPVGQRLRLALLQLRARRLGRLVLLAVLCVVVGAVAGRLTAPSGDDDARLAIEAGVMPLVVDADSIWTSSSDDRVPVAEALLALRGGNPRLVEESVEDWQAAYDAILVRLAGLDLPPAARSVQREFIIGVTISRDATDVLAHAASVTDPDHRRDLVTEAARLRQRSEQVVQSARASTLDLAGGRGDVGPLPPLPTFLEGRRG